MKTIIATCLLILFSACSSKTPSSNYAPKELPSWYLNPPSNTSKYLYGLGEGKNLKQARSNALEGMISQLGVSISSSYQSKLQSKGVYHQYLSKDITHTLKEDVAKIRISNYQLMQNHKQAYNHFIVLLRSDKKIFTQGLHQIHKTEVKKIKADLQAYQKRNVLLRHNFYAQSLKKLEELLPNTLILSSLDTKFDDSPYLQLVSKINHEFQDLKSTMTFSMTHDQNSRAYREEIQVALAKKGIKLASTNKRDKNHIFIDLKTSAQYSQAHGFKIVKTVLMIEVKDAQNTIIAGNKIRLTGQATQTEALALENSSKKLQKTISKTGISEVLGLKNIF